MDDIKVLPYNGIAFEEIRPAYFLKAFGEDVLDMRIFSFGRCNYSCPYCKRSGYDKASTLDIEGAIDVNEREFYKKIDESITKHEVIRLSGGDPVCYPELSLRLLKYAKEKGGITSIAHNGSGTEFVKKILMYLDFASIDFKASSPSELAEIAGITPEMAKITFANTIRTIRELANAGVLVDIRTCIFDTTTPKQLEEIAQLIYDEGKNIENIFWTFRTYSAIESFSKNPKNPDEMKKIALDISSKFEGLRIGIRQKWVPGGFLYFINGKELSEFFKVEKSRFATNNRKLIVQCEDR